MNRAVFLERDGMLIAKPEDPRNPDHIRLLQGSANAVASLHGLGFKIVIATNQEDVAYGRVTEDELDVANRVIAEQVQSTAGAAIDRFYYCPYHPEGTINAYRRDHHWRKPQPGMYRKASEDLQLNLAGSWLIAHSSEDTQAGRAVGMRIILIQTGGMGPANSPAIGGMEPEFTAKTLAEAVRLISAHRSEDEPPEPLAKPTPSVAQTAQPAGVVEAEPFAKEMPQEPSQPSRGGWGSVSKTNTSPMQPTPAAAASTQTPAPSQPVVPKPTVREEPLAEPVSPAPPAPEPKPTVISGDTSAPSEPAGNRTVIPGGTRRGKTSTGGKRTFVPWANQPTADELATDDEQVEGLESGEPAIAEQPEVDPNISAHPDKPKVVRPQVSGAADAESLLDNVQLAGESTETATNESTSNRQTPTTPAKPNRSSAATATAKQGATVTSSTTARPQSQQAKPATQSQRTQTSRASQPTSTTGGLGDAESTELLRQIHQQLKHLQVSREDFSVFEFISAICQVGVFGLVLIGLLLESDVMPWLTGGILLQLVSITLLLFQRSR